MLIAVLFAVILAAESLPGWAAVVIAVMSGTGVLALVVKQYGRQQARRAAAEAKESTWLREQIDEMEARHTRRIEALEARHAALEARYEQSRQEAHTVAIEANNLRMANAIQQNEMNALSAKVADLTKQLDDALARLKVQENGNHPRP